MTDSTNTSAATLGIQAGDTVRLIGVPTEFEEALTPLPDGVTITSLAWESAQVGIIAVEDDNDLRERLFTELDGLLGAHHVWILTTASGPDETAIQDEANLVSWTASNAVSVGNDWTVVPLQKG